MKAGKENKPFGHPKLKMEDHRRSGRQSSAWISKKTYRSGLLNGN